MDTRIDGWIGWMTVGYTMMMMMMNLLQMVGWLVGCLICFGSVHFGIFFFFVFFLYFSISFFLSCFPSIFFPMFSFSISGFVYTHTHTLYKYNKVFFECSLAECSIVQCAVVLCCIVQYRVQCRDSRWHFGFAGYLPYSWLPLKAQRANCKHRTKRCVSLKETHTKIKCLSVKNKMLNN